MPGPVLEQNYHNAGEKRVRLDHYLAQQYPDISRAFLQKLCNSDQVLVNGSPQKSGYKMRSVDKIDVLYDIAGIEKIAAIELPVLYQDENVLVINKPAGVISHSRGKFWNEPSVASFIRQVTDQTGERSGIVHRLDRPTSGVMICAKNQATMVFLQKQFADHKVKKTYIAVIAGHLKLKQAIIDMPIERNPKAPASFRVGSNGKPSQTKYTVTASSEAYDQLELEPATGRTHQLRVHLAHQGHPIIGDTLYNGAPAERLYLHAYQLQLDLPNKLSQIFTAPLPVEFASLMGLPS